MSSIDYERYIADIVDYPEPGIVFKDITPLLGDAEAFTAAVDDIAEHFADQGITKVIGAEARGFAIGAPVAYRLGAGLVLARKPGKLPRQTISEEYALEYGTDSLHIHADSVGPDDVVLIVDDLVATGGTAVAQYKLAKKVGAKVAGYGFLLELEFLNPKEKIQEVADVDVYSLIKVK